MDDERRELERKIKSEGLTSNQEALAKLQRLNERAGPSLADIEYLHSYLNICEKVLGLRSGTERRINLAKGLKELRDLNERLGTQISASVSKNRLIIRDSLFYSEGSQYIYVLCDKAKERAKADGVDKECKTCEQVIIDGWVPFNVC